MSKNSNPEHQFTNFFQELTIGLSPRERMVVSFFLFTCLILLLASCGPSDDVRISDYCEENPSDARFCDPTTGAPRSTQPGIGPTTPGIPGSFPETAVPTLPSGIRPGATVEIPPGGNLFSIAMELAKVASPPKPTAQFSNDPEVHKYEMVRMTLVPLVVDEIKSINNIPDVTKIPANSTITLPDSSRLNALYQEALRLVLLKLQRYQSLNFSARIAFADIGPTAGA